MNHKAYLLCALSLLLGSCASGSDEQSRGSSPAGSAKAASAPLGDEVVEPWLGRWVVTEAFGATLPGQPPKPPVGQHLVLTRAMATDLDGRTCPKPAFKGDTASEAAFLGLTEIAATSLQEARIRLSVACEERAFGQYLVARDGSLLARAGGKTLRMERAPEAAAAPSEAVTPKGGEAAPAPTALLAPRPAQADAAPAAKPAPAASPGAAQGALVYLASYREKESALAGWKKLQAMSPLLGKAQPALTSVTLPGQGSFLRLQARGLSDADGAALCKALIRTLPDCGARNRQ